MIIRILILFGQIVGTVVPLVGCFFLIQKEQSRNAKCLLLTSLSCFLLNVSYSLAVWETTADGAYAILKIEYLANAMFYLSFCYFLCLYMHLERKMLLRAVMILWGVLETINIINIWTGDARGLFYKSVEFQRDEELGVMMAEIVPGAMYMLRYSFLAFLLFLFLIYTTINMLRLEKGSERNNLGKIAGAEFLIGVALVSMLSIDIGYDVVPVTASLAVLSIVLGVVKGDFFSVMDSSREWVLDHSDNLLVVADKKGRYLDANAKAKSVFEGLKGLGAGEALPEEVIGLFSDTSGRTIELADRYYTRQVAGITQDGETVGQSLLLTDVSEQQELMTQLEAAKEKAEEANEAKSAFMSNMSHEIRTPMNAIVGMTDILLREKLSGQTREYLNNIKSSGDALLSIINDILDFSKIESGKMEIVEEEYEPMSLLNDLSMIFLNRIGEKPVELLYDVDPSLPAKLFGDAKRIRQVIINITNNAVKFTEEGYVKLEIRAEKGEDPGDGMMLSVSVRDTGQGIKEEDIGKLFGAFSQVDTKKNHSKEGTGLGLSISRQLVELMGGEIGVESVYGEGSRFYFHIPQKIVQDTPAAAIRNSGSIPYISGYFKNTYVGEAFQKLAQEYGVRTYPAGLEEAVYPPELDFFLTDSPELLGEGFRLKFDPRTTLCVLQNPMLQNLSGIPAAVVNKPLYSLNFCNLLNRELTQEQNQKEELLFEASQARILIVDDTPMNLKVAMGLLEPLKMQIDTAENGKEAVDKISGTDYDLVFMDHMMPVMDGIEATGAIRGMEGEKYQKLPIVALTANATADAQKLFAESGFTDFVSKPIRMKEICKCLRKWLPEEKITEKVEEAYTPDSGNHGVKEHLGNGFGQFIEEPDTDSLPVIEGLDSAAGVENSGTKELFFSLLGDFYKLIDRKGNLIEKYLADRMVRDFTIEVHAMKSTARMIGALELSERFLRLEQMGDKGDVDGILREAPGTLEMLRRLKPALKPFGIKTEEQKHKVSKTELVEALQQIVICTENFDQDGADYAMKFLEECAFPEKYRERVEELGILVADMAKEDTIALAKDLAEELAADCDF